MVELGTEGILIVEVDGCGLQLEAVIDATVEGLRSFGPLWLALAVATFEALGLPALSFRCIIGYFIQAAGRRRFLSWAAADLEGERL